MQQTMKPHCFPSAAMMGVGKDGVTDQSKHFSPNGFTSGYTKKQKLSCRFLNRS